MVESIYIQGIVSIAVSSLISIPGKSFFKRMDLKALPWTLGFVLIIILSLDFWNWNKALPLVFGLPYWIVSFIFLILFLSAYYALFCRFYWRGE